MAKVTFNRIANGQFQVLNNGVATEYSIVNGCLGVSGNGRNEYLIISKGKNVQTGISLAKAKKLAAHYIEKAEKNVAVTEDDELNGWVPVSEEVAAENMQQELQACSKVTRMF